MLAFAPEHGRIDVTRDWYIGCAQPSQGCETSSTLVSRSSKTPCFLGIFALYGAVRFFCGTICGTIRGGLSAVRNERTPPGVGAVAGLLVAQVVLAVTSRPGLPSSPRW